MSYEIERLKKCIRFKDDSPTEEDDFFIYTELASNNVIPHSYSNVFIGAGWRYECLKGVCEWAGECEGGMLKPYGKESTAESYIKRWKEVIDNTPPISKLQVPVRLILTVRQELKTIKLKEYEDRFMKEIENTYKCSEESYFDEDCIKIVIDATEWKHFIDWRKALSILKENKLLVFYKIE